MTESEEILLAQAKRMLECGTQIKSLEELASEVDMIKTIFYGRESAEYSFVENLISIYDILKNRSADTSSGLTKEEKTAIQQLPRHISKGTFEESVAVEVFQILQHMCMFGLQSDIELFVHLSLSCATIVPYLPYNPDQCSRVEEFVKTLINGVTTSLELLLEKLISEKKPCLQSLKPVLVCNFMLLGVIGETGMHFGQYYCTCGLEIMELMSNLHAVSTVPSVEVDPQLMMQIKKLHQRHRVSLISTLLNNDMFIETAVQICDEVEESPLILLVLLDITVAIGKTDGDNSCAGRWIEGGLLDTIFSLVHSDTFIPDLNISFLDEDKKTKQLSLYTLVETRLQDFFLLLGTNPAKIDLAFLMTQLISDSYWAARLSRHLVTFLGRTSTSEALYHLCNTLFKASTLLNIHGSFSSHLMLVISELVCLLPSHLLLELVNKFPPKTYHDVWGSIRSLPQRLRRKLGDMFIFGIEKAVEGKNWEEPSLASFLRGASYSLHEDNALRIHDLVATIWNALEESQNDRLPEKMELKRKFFDFLENYELMEDQEEKGRKRLRTGTESPVCESFCQEETLERTWSILLPSLHFLKREACTDLESSMYIPKRAEANALNNLVLDASKFTDVPRRWMIVELCLLTCKLSQYVDNENHVLMMLQTLGKLLPNATKHVLISAADLIRKSSVFLKTMEFCSAEKMLRMCLVLLRHEDPCVQWEGARAVAVVLSNSEHVTELNQSLLSSYPGHHQKVTGVIEQFSNG